MPNAYIVYVYKYNYNNITKPPIDYNTNCNKLKKTHDTRMHGPFRGFLPAN